MSKLTIYLLTVLVVTSCLTDAYRILVVFPLPGKSHNILGEGIVKLLLEAGHEVTYLTPFPKNEKNPKLHEIDVSQNIEALSGGGDMFAIKAIMDGKINLDNQAFMLYFMTVLSKTTLENENVQAMLNDVNQEFDLIINEWMYSDVYAGLAAVYNCPYIWFSSMEPHWLILSLIDDYPNPAFTPDISSTNKPPFSFRQRLGELWIQTVGTAVKFFYTNGADRAEYERSIVPAIVKRGRPVPLLDDIKYNASMVLANAHVSLGLSISLPQSFKSVGGYHIDRNVKPLPENLKKIMDSSKDGVIYFSMGSNLKSKDLPDELKQSFLEMFGSLKQTVLWKFEEVLPNLPKNVHILQWAPQQSILAHPKCILFITHGGYLSTNEAVHFGVPTIGIPVFGDQFFNVDRAVQKGYAKRIDLSYTMTDGLKAAVVEMISNPMYARKVKELSTIYHDRPVTPGVELVHWVEHVLKTGGAPHLRSPALNVPWYQKLYLDLLTLILVLIIVLVIALKRLFLRKTSKVASKSKDGKKKKN